MRQSYKAHVIWDLEALAKDFDRTHEVNITHLSSKESQSGAAVTTGTLQTGQFLAASCLSGKGVTSVYLSTPFLQCY